MTRPRLLLGALLLLALLPRLAAVRYNVWPHGDVLLDAAVTDALATTGELKVPIVDVRFYPIGRFGFGYPPTSTRRCGRCLGCCRAWSG